MIDNSMKQYSEISEDLPGRVLIVDDDPDVLNAIKDLVSMDGEYIIETATDVFTAKTKLNEFKPDIALLDIRLGNGSGLDLISFIKRESENTDCIMMTAHREVNYAVEALRCGAVDYLFKPIAPVNLLQTIETYFHKRKVKQDKINKELHFKLMALRDPLTGLANRTMLAEHMEQILARARRNEQAFSVVFIDLDNFKKINDSFGHLAGDELLKNIAQSLNDGIRDGDIIARIGGDEFIIVLGPESDINTSRVVVERLMHSINEMVLNKGHGDIVSASIGIASFPEDGMTADTLISNADAAMYMAKKNGKNCFQFYNH